MLTVPTSFLKCNSSVYLCLTACFIVFVYLFIYFFLVGGGVIAHNLFVPRKEGCASSLNLFEGIFLCATS